MNKSAVIVPWSESETINQCIGELMTLPAEIHPAAGLMLHYARGALEMARGRYPQALVAFRAAERLAGLLVTSGVLLAGAGLWAMGAWLRAAPAREPAWLPA